MNQELTFGVEIECYGNKNDLLVKLRELGVNVDIRDYDRHHTPLSDWKITSDGSLCSSTDGIELVSPILKGEEGLKVIRKVCSALNAVKARVDKSCGLHVHVGVQNEELDFFKNIYKIYAGFETVIDGFMPFSRRANNATYCKSHKEMTDMVIDQASNIYDLNRFFGFSDRYYKLNLQSFFRQGTIEFRHHSGTTNSAKIISWVNFCLNMVEAAKKPLPENMKGEVTETTVLVDQNKPYVRTYSKQWYVLNHLWQRGSFTQEEANTVMNSNTWGSLGQLLRNNNVAFDTVQESHKKRFILKKVEKKTTTVVKNFDYNMDNMVNLLNLDSLTASFFEARQEEFVNG